MCLQLSNMGQLHERECLQHLAVQHCSQCGFLLCYNCPQGFGSGLDLRPQGLGIGLCSIEMVGGLITGLYPNLIQNAFFSSSVFIGSKCFWQTTQNKFISIHGSGKGSGTRSLGQAKAPEPFARAKQKPCSHEPGSSKGSGTICLGQAKVEGKLKGQKAGTELRTPICD